MLKKEARKQKKLIKLIVQNVKPPPVMFKNKEGVHENSTLKGNNLGIQYYENNMRKNDYNSLVNNLYLDHCNH